MVDQNSQFYAILTNVGAAKQANADALGIAWKITQMGVGDANGTDPTPNATQTSLINEWRRAPLNQLKVDDNDASIIVAEQVIPADIGGKWIREIGLYDEAGDLVAVANCAPTYKPVLSQGSGRTQVLRMSLVVSNAANVQLKIDPSVVLATREWVTEELARQDFKHSVLAATTANITLSGLQTIDGVALTAGARVLVKNQTAAKDNGLYTVVSGGAWTRSTDANSNAKVTPGLLVLVEKGTLNSDSAWQLVTDATITLGVTALSFEMAFGRSGVTAGTYRSVQVDKYGRVVAATNPTTVAGYAITDVYTKSETFSKTETTQAISSAVDVAVAALVAAAPGALDTLKELATAIGNDPNFATTMVNELAKKAPLASPKLTGVPEAPTAPVGTNTPQIATMAAILQALAAFGIGTSIIPLTADANTLAEGCLFRTTNTTLNIPVAASGCGIHIPFGGGPALQLWGILSAGAGARLFWRASASSSWSPWNEITKLDSPALTGNPTAPTQPVGDNDTSIATTGFVQAALAAFGIGAGKSAYVSDLNALKGTCFFGAANTAVGAPESAGAYDAIGWQVECSGQRTQFLVSSAFRLQIRTDDSNDYSGFEAWGELATLDALNALASNIATQLSAKAPLASPDFTGAPKAPTATKGTNTTQLATTAFVQAAMAALVDTAPGALDTLKELADALGNDPNFAGTMIAELAKKAPLASPKLTGVPEAPTAAVGTNTPQIATMAAILQGLAAFGIGTGTAKLIADFDGQTAGGFFYCTGADSAGIPYQNNGFAIHVPWNGTSAGLQIYAAASANVIKWRTKSSGTWRPWNDFALLASPDFTDNPRAPTQAVSDNSRALATTAFVNALLGVYGITTGQSSRPADLNALRGFRLFGCSDLTTGSPSASAAYDAIGWQVEAVGQRTQFVVASGGRLKIRTDDSSDASGFEEWVDLATVAEVNAAIVASAPPGKVAHFATATPPAGWLKRNGAAYSRTTYAALFAAIGTTFGAGDGSTTFNVPDDRELIDRAWTDGLNAADAGRALFSAQAGQLESHTHTGTAASGGAHTHTTTIVREKIPGDVVTGEGGNAVFGDQQTDGTQNLTTSSSGTHTHTLTINATGGNETRMANRAYLACIKY